MTTLDSDRDFDVRYDRYLDSLWSDPVFFVEELGKDSDDMLIQILKALCGSGYTDRPEEQADRYRAAVAVVIKWMVTLGEEWKEREI